MKRVPTWAIESKYDIGQQIGDGFNAVVFKATCRSTGEPRAIKKVSAKSVDATMKLRHEAEIQASVEHPNIVRVFDFLSTERAAYIVMDLCSGGELFRKVNSDGRLSESQAAFVLRCTLRAVACLHGQDIAHRDVKLENLILELDGPVNEDNGVKLADFGAAVRCGPDTILRELVGTPFYVAPQVIRKNYTRSCDVWSCGVVLFVLLSGRLPFFGGSDPEVLAKVRRGNVHYDEGLWSGVTEGARDLLRRLLVSRVKERLSAEQALLHEWVLSQEPRTSSRGEAAVAGSPSRLSAAATSGQAASPLAAHGVAAPRLALASGSSPLLPPGSASRPPVVVSTSVLHVVRSGRPTAAVAFPSSATSSPVSGTSVYVCSPSRRVASVRSPVSAAALSPGRSPVRCLMATDPSPRSPTCAGGAAAGLVAERPRPLRRAAGWS